MTSMLGLTLALTSCSDVMDEITSLALDRNLSPINLEARVQDRTNVKLSWTTVNGATGYIIEQYDNDSLSFDGKTASATYTVSADDVPYTISGLEGETEYSFRVMSVTAGDDSRNSKWSEAYAKTGTEQIIYSLGENDVKARSVTITWPAGQSAARIVVTDAAGNIAADHALTADEIAAGAATITGLTPETSYSAKMLRSTGKTRGTVSFTTAIELAENDILVKAGDDLATAIANAPAGARLVIMPGTYTITDADGVVAAGAADINKSLTIKGLRQNDHPVIKGRFTISGGSDIAFDQVTLDGTGTSGDQAIVFKAEGEYNSLSVTNSEVKNYTKGFYYINVAANVKTITIDNNVLLNIECNGGDFFDCRTGAIQNLVITNNTIYGSCAERDFIRYDDASANFPGVAPVINVDHNTLDGVSLKADGTKRLLYIRFAGNSIAFTNNIVTNTAANFSNQSKTTEPTFKGNYYFNAPNLLPGGINGKFFDASGIVADPAYTNAAAGDFTVGNEDIAFAKAGAPRWIK